MMLACLPQGGRQGALSYGLQTNPQHRLNDLTGTAKVQRLAEACQEHMSYCVAYSPLATSTPPGDVLWEVVQLGINSECGLPPWR